MEERDNKLHLADERRCQMGTAVGSYFQWMFKNEEDKNGNKDEGFIKEKELGINVDKNGNTMDGVAKRKERKLLANKLNSYLRRKK